jgi:hypothetical protein
MEGWIKIYKKLSEKAYYSKDSEKVHVWIHILIKASHQDREEMFAGKAIICQPGQFTTGRKQLSTETGISESKIERILNYFEKIEQQIEQQKSSTNRLITILNWEQYQVSEQQIEQQSNNDRTTSEQQSNNDRTTSEQQSNNDRTHSKNIRIKEYKNKRNKEEGKSENPISHPPKSFEERTKIFYDEIAAFSGTYPKEMLRSFFNYWSEMSRDGKKMKFEKEETWELAKRLQTWQRNEEKFNPKAVTQTSTQPILPYYKKLGQK